MLERLVIGALESLAHVTQLSVVNTSHNYWGNNYQLLASVWFPD
jgi:hypothetical protein